MTFGNGKVTYEQHPDGSILEENVLSTPRNLLFMIHSVNQFKWKKQVVKIYLSYDFMLHYLFKNIYVKVASLFLVAEDEIFQYILLMNSEITNYM